MGNKDSIKIGEWEPICPSCNESLLIEELPIVMTCPFCNSLIALKEDDKGDIVIDKDGQEAAKYDIENKKEVEALDELKITIASMLDDGQKKEKIEKELIKAGCDKYTANQLVESAENNLGHFKESLNNRVITSEKYKGHMIFGAFLFFIGVAVSIVTLSSSTSGSGAGPYIIWTGAIVGGIIELFRGFYRWQNYKRARNRNK